MPEASCHCGAVRITVPAAPEFLVDCNCSICRRLGALWAFYPAAEMRLIGHPEHTAAYVWGQKTIRTLHCTICGCATHWEPLESKPGMKFSINARLLDPAVIEGVRVRHFDGADEWVYLD